MVDHKTTKTSFARLTIIAFTVEAVLAGGNGVAIRFSNRELAPLWGAGFRFAIASVLLAGLMLVLRLALPQGRKLVGGILFGLLQFAGAFGFFYVALVQIQAGLGQTLLALVPLATLLLAVAQRQEVLKPSAMVGTLLCLVGVGLIFFDPMREPIPVGPLLMVLASVLCFAEALVLVRHMPALHPITLNAIGMGVGALILITASIVLGEARILPNRTETWAALAYVVAIGSVAVFLLHVFVVQQWSASRASYVMVLIPLVAVALSAWLDGEVITAGFLLGGSMVVVGVYIGAFRANSLSSGESREIH